MKNELRTNILHIVWQRAVGDHNIHGQLHLGEIHAFCNQRQHNLCRTIGYQIVMQPYNINVMLTICKMSRIQRAICSMPQIRTYLMAPDVSG